MARPVRYPDSIEPLVQFVEETAPEQIVARTHDRLAAGTPMKDMLLASALAVVRSSDLPPGHHGGPLHPLAGLHAVRHIATRLPGEFARLPIIQNVAVANKHIHSPAMGPYILAHAEPVSERDDVEATLEAFRMAAGRGVFNACDHYALYLLEKLSPMRCSSTCSRSPSPRTSSTITTSCSRSSPGGRWSISAGSTPSSSAARRCATSRVRPCPPRWTRSTTLIAKFGLLERDLRLSTGRRRDGRPHRAGRRDRALPSVHRRPRAAGARARRRAVAGRRRRGALGGGLDALPALADRQPDGRAPEHRRQHAPVPDPPAGALAPHQAPGAADLEHGTRKC